jgi:hypothetical protein
MANAKPVYDYGVYSTFDGRVGSHIITVPGPSQLDYPTKRGRREDHAEPGRHGGHRGAAKGETVMDAQLLTQADLTLSGPWPVEPGELSILNSRDILRATVVTNTGVIGPGGNNLLTAIFVGYDWPEK